VLAFLVMTASAFGSLFAVTMLGLMVFWTVAPVVGIIRASMRKAKGDSSALAPILAGASLAVMVLFSVFVFLVKHKLPGSKWSYFELILNVGWLYYAVHANRHAAALRAKRISGQVATSS